MKFVQTPQACTGGLWTLPAEQPAGEGTHLARRYPKPWTLL